MASYEFVTIWREAPLQKVWNEIYHTEYWPQWWKGVIQVVMSWGAESLAKRLDTKVSQVQLGI
ncbi:MAG: hypothetical protein ACERKJ_06725 [Candidatus Dadabacteria bacterium]|jgi:hypothetical protein